MEDLKEPNKPRKRFVYGKYFLSLLLGSVVVLGLIYGYLIVNCSDKSLPRLTLYGKEMGLKTKLETRYTIEQIQKSIDKSKAGVNIRFNDQTVAKSYEELGIKIENAKTTEKFLKYGKINNRYPSLDYILKTVRGTIPLTAEFYWVKNPKETFDTFSKEKRVDPIDPSIKITDGKYELIDGKDGLDIDTTLLKSSIEKCFVENCKKPIVSKVTTKKSNFSLADLSPFKDKISSILDNKYSFTFENKTVSPNLEQVASFIDLEMTALNQDLTLKDKAIAEYLNSVAGKFTQKPLAKKISTVDNAVIDEGREGTQLNIEESTANVKKAILNGDKTAELSVKVAEPKEEFVGPGYTLGKYSGKYIEVNLSEQNLYRIEGNQLLGTYRVSTGKWSMPTPTGEYSINNKDPRAYSQKYDLYMPYWMAFIGSEYGIHELPEWANGTKEGEAHLGTPVSHGCIRLGRGSAEEVYNWADVGTAVIIHE